MENVEQIKAPREFQSTQYSSGGEWQGRGKCLSSQKSQTGISMARQECSIIKGSCRRAVGFLGLGLGLGLGSCACSRFD